MQKKQAPDTASGVLGEEKAAEKLLEDGFEILCRNYRTRFGEIDIIAQNAEYIVFVEVKTRSRGSLGNPLEAVTAAKQHKIILAAQRYLQKHPAERQPRFDVIAVITENGTVREMNHLVNAFMC